MMPTRDPATIRRACERILSVDPAPPAKALGELAAYAADAAADHYAEGQLAERLEARAASLLGKPAALFFPTGTMAQALVLRILADRALCSRIAMHPRCHLEESEHAAYRELWGLGGVALGGPERMPHPADLAAIPERLGAIALEMPMRRLGCILSPWSDLESFAEQARARGVALHLDGARIWEAQPYYHRTAAEIAALFDTVYVAFDKGLGALGGSAIAGPADVIAEARLWRHRAGGRVLRSYPYLLSSMKALDDNLDRMPALYERAVALARLLAAVPGLCVTPDPPHTNAMLVTMPGDPAEAEAAVLDVAEATGTWLFDRTVDCPIHGMVSFEMTMRVATLDVDLGPIRDAIADFAKRLAAMSKRR
jgi:threonine aldolase